MNLKHLAASLIALLGVLLIVSVKAPTPAAATVQPGQDCVLCVLNPTASAALAATGNAVLRVTNGAIAVISSSSQALSASGNAVLAVSGNAMYQVTAPGSRAYSGVAVFADRNNASTLSLTRNGTGTWTEAIDAASGGLSLSANGASRTARPQ